MKVFKFNVSGIVVTFDNEYTFYEHNNDRFKNFGDHGYSGNISIAMAKINNLILGNPDFYLTDINVSETDDSEYRRKKPEDDKKIKSTCSHCNKDFEAINPKLYSDFFYCTDCLIHGLT